MKRILFRCDASLLIGSGHVIRCRNLARELQRNGAEISFICRSQPGDLIGMLKKEFSVLTLPEQPLSACDGLEGRDLYRAWLGCSQDQDATQCLQILIETGISTASWLVVDHYGLDERWEVQLIKGLTEFAESPQLLVIDDLADRPHKANLLLDQNFFGAVTTERYQKFVPTQCRQLLGPHYALLGHEYAQLHPLIPPRIDTKRVLVFFGGVDSSNLTAKALKALMDPALADLAVDVVLGLHSPHRQGVAELVAHRPNTTLHDTLPSLAGLIARADLGIGAGGTTTWERACLGLPSLVVALAANQLPFAEALDEAGYIRLLGDEASVNTVQIRSALLSLISNSEVGKRSTALTDGWGAPRLAMAMMPPSGAISLRPVTAADEGLLSQWADDPQVRVRSISPAPISPGDHHHWFHEDLSKANSHLLIATTANSCPIGQLSLSRQSPKAHGETTQAKLWLMLDHCAIGNGLEAELIRLGLQLIEHHWGPINDIENKVLVNNDSNACFTSADFAPISEFALHQPEVTSCDSLVFQPGRITILSDSSSWLNAFLPELIILLWQRGHSVRWIHTPSALQQGDVCLLLSCSRMLNAAELALHRYNLVVHASALPKGQGWSPMSWQILEGASSIPISLFEAAKDLDSGSIYLQRQIALQGFELVGEWRAFLAQATLELCKAWFDRYQEVVNAAQPQHGEASHYYRRRPADSELDPESSLAEQFNLLRVVDNKSYPAFFQWNNKRYELWIERS